MPISRRVEEALAGASWIRRMFEEGNRLRQLHGADAICDFTLGNPDLPPPPAFLQKLRELVAREPGEMHRYMPNAGWPEVRQKIAASLQERTGLPYEGEHLLMTVGAGGALNVMLKALLDPDDEVVILAPYFVEYLFYIQNHGGKAVVAETTEDFGIDAEAVAAAITDRTRVVIINSPNNPTGRVYSREELTALSDVLRDVSARRGEPIYLVTDEPYRKIVYSGVHCPEVPPFYDHTILITSHSKDLGLAGERIGYLALPPGGSETAALVAACTFALRVLGFVNAPSLFQLAIADCQDVKVDVSIYERRGELLVEHLRSLGFSVQAPGGAFYLFPQSPIADETEFLERLMQEKILVVPGRGFGRPGYFRLSYAVADAAIERSLPGWARVAAEYPQLTPESTH